MRMCWIIVACAALLAGGVLANSSTASSFLELARQQLQPLISSNEGSEYTMNIVTLLDEIASCSIVTPRKVIVEVMPVDQTGDKYEVRPSVMPIGCSVAIMNMDQNDNGLWEIHTTSVAGVQRSQSFDITVIAQDTATEGTVGEESSAQDNYVTEDTVTEETPRRITELPEQTFETKMGSRHRVVIDVGDGFTIHESCHIVSPDGNEHNLLDFKMTGVIVVDDLNVACGVDITLEDEEAIGKWTLISRENFLSTPVEKRLSFTIYVEEIVDAIPESTIITEGNDLYIRLANSTDLFSTCKLVMPEFEGKNAVTYQNDENYVNNCGFILRDIRHIYSGRWEIRYGNKIVYRAFTDVYVTDRKEGAELEIALTWTKDRPVEETLGPEDAVYCKIEDPKGVTVFEGFGRCRVAFARVTLDHHGIWKMFVGSPGRVLTEEYEVTVEVTEAAPKGLVTTSVETDKPSVMLSCSLESEKEVKACKFRDPSGRVLIASQAIGEDRYSFHGVSTSLESNVHQHDCGLRITNPEVSDLGIWRCAVETEEDTVYGFLSVLCPWAMRDEQIAAQVVSEPILTAERGTVHSVEGDSVTMSCSIQSMIHYCYFRARNGTVFNVGPGTDETADFTYVGAGFDSGECGIRFKNLLATDSGNWSCHVGFNVPQESEQRANFVVDVEEALTATQELFGGHNGVLRIIGKAHSGRHLEYCRFVRIDGLGFTSENVPGAYETMSSLSDGLCQINIARPTILELHPWTVVARIRGQDIEVSDVTEHSIDWPELTPPTPNPSSSMMGFLIMVILIIISICLVCFLVSTKNRRVWASMRATSISNTLRTSFRGKVPIPPNEGNTAAVA